LHFIIPSILFALLIGSLNYVLHLKSSLLITPVHVGYLESTAATHTYAATASTATYRVISKVYSD